MRRQCDSIFCLVGTYIGHVENCLSVTVSQDEGRAGGL